MTEVHEPPQDSYPVPPTAKMLEGLVEHLYPEPGVVDILTLDQFQFRYKFSGLGATAVADMERAQRITRRLGDHGQIGLAEFHIGLIYLDWGQLLGAAPFFGDAERHWHFVPNKYGVVLAQFAQGAAHHHAYAYENALSYYGKVQKLLTKIETGQTPTHPQFRERLRACLDACRDDVVAKIRSFGEGEPVSFRITIAEQTLATDDLPTQAADVPAPDSPTPSTDRTAPMPIIRLNKPAQMSATIEETPAAEPAPSAPTADSPIPDHPNQSDHFIWYDVVDRQDVEDFLPAIQAENVFLVDTRTELYTCQPGDLIIVDQEDAEGSIQVEPQQAAARDSARRRIYLGEVDEELAFIRDVETGDVQFNSTKEEETGKIRITSDQQDFPVYAEEIIGIVIGIWTKLNPART